MKIGTNLSEEIGDWFGGGITMVELEGTVLSVLILGPEERLLSMGQGGGKERICEKSRREASAVACFRLPALLDAASKATLVVTPRDGRVA